MVEINDVVRISKSNIPWSTGQIVKMIDNEKIVFDNLIQRSYVWDVKRRSMLIWSLIKGIPLPPIYAKCTQDIENLKNKIYDILDGKQRLITVAKFLRGEFALSELPPIMCTDINGEEFPVDISGKTFSELDKEFRHILETFNFSVIYFDDLTRKEQAEVFKALNNGKPLTTKSRTLASCADLDNAMAIGSHELFDDMLTKKAKENKNQITMVMKMWSVLYSDLSELTFESKTFNTHLEHIMIEPNEAQEIERVLDYAKEVHDMIYDTGAKKLAKKLYTETHLVSIFPFIKRCVDNETPTGTFVNWFRSFFDTQDARASFSNMYNNVLSGSARNSAILTRHEELDKSYNEFFNEEQ